MVTHHNIVMSTFGRSLGTSHDPVDFKLKPGRLVRERNSQVVDETDQGIRGIIRVILG